MKSSRPDHPTLGILPQSSSLSTRSGSPSANNSPIEPTTGSSLRSPFGFPGGISSLAKMSSAPRSGAGSPSNDLTGVGRPFSKRAREIQAQEGVPMNLWGPPTSGNSTPLRENIPESPTDGFPEFAPLPTPDTLPSTRRARAGTLPSRFSPGGAVSGLASLPGLMPSKSTRVTPSPSPFKSPSPSLGEIADAAVANNALLQRLRAGSMPQRGNFGQPNPFGGLSVFSSNWGSGGRERTSTLASIASLGSNGPSSPAQSSFSREGMGGENDMQIRTLDYLGLADTPQPPRAQLASNSFLANMNADLNKQASRFRSYSVNATEKYADEEDEEYGTASMNQFELQQARLEFELAQTNAAIQQHNLAVQAYANQASTNRPRARTAGVLESPASRLLRNYYPTVTRLDNGVNVNDLSSEYDGLPEAVQALRLGQNNTHLNADESQEGPTSALWLGNIPSSTTVSTLQEMFKSHGPIKSARVLTHKNCGFVNFEHTESAINAKAMMNGKEIFPGNGPVRINFAKPASATGTPGHDGAYPSPSPDPFAKGQEKNDGTNLDTTTGTTAGVVSRPGSAALTMPNIQDMRADIMDMVTQFGASDQDRIVIADSLQIAIAFRNHQSEIPPVQEAAQNRVHDAPRLRDIRKRIDNNGLSPAEIESTAIDMLPEVAELASDYLGNTVVQKLFEFCSDPVRDAMLREIAPHMAEIGVHKNGTWAAQKIIDVAKQQNQMTLIVDALRPYTVPLFLDQFGNYVLQCCLRFGAPYNNFIFETMLVKLWDIAQGRYGARAMRACLESHHSTRDQQRMLAAAIALHSVQLATNANGALLLTWYLDTCTFPERRSVLAPRLIQHLVHLCTHKVAYLTVLKVINQRNENEAREAILKALFMSPEQSTLEEILSDHTCGATLIFKVLTTPFFEENLRPQAIENVRTVLLRLKAQPNQGYKRLMDEVGMSTRNGSVGPNREQNHQSHSTERRPSSRSSHTNSHAQQHQQPQQQIYNNNFFPPSAPAFEMQRTDSMDSGMSPYPTYGNQQPLFSNNVPLPPPTLSHLQYQQSMLGRSGPALNTYYPAINGGFNAFGTPSPIDNYRITPAPNSIQPSQMSVLGNGFAPPGYGIGGFPYGGAIGMQNMPHNVPVGLGYMPQEPTSGRRGRQR